MVGKVLELFVFWFVRIVEVFVPPLEEPVGLALVMVVIVVERLLHFRIGIQDSPPLAASNFLIYYAPKKPPCKGGF